MYDAQQICGWADVLDKRRTKAVLARALDAAAVCNYCRRFLVEVVEYVACPALTVFMSFIHYSSLTSKEIVNTARGQGFQIPRSASRRKEDLLAFIAQNASPNIISALVLQAHKKETSEPKGRKRRRTEEPEGERPHIRRRVVEFRPVKPRHTYDHNKYLELPTADEVKACYRCFYEATSNAAVKMVVCGVCSREVGIQDDGVRMVRLQDLPNVHRLVPHQPHPAHCLFNGKILEPAGVHGVIHDAYKVNVCRQCWTSLENTKYDLPPALSLANNMWIGPVPDVLSSLTFPEQLLISHLYPRVYVFKLYPKKGSGGDPSKLQKGMRGTVSTFELDMQGITSMLEGNLMPRPAELLASVISVTYIGLGHLPKHWLRHLFRVRRRHVFSALQWLNVNNPKYYGNTVIDHGRLHSLPEDDIPVELLSIVRQSTDVQIVDQESAGYVPVYGEDENENDPQGDDEHEPVPELQDVDGSEDEEPEAQDHNSDDPIVVPLQAIGSIDVDFTKLTAGELMAWGLANLWQEGGEGAYAVRHGRRPVSDFGRPRSGEESDPNRDNFFEKAFPCLFPYGRGGIEADRPVEVEFSEHVRWALQYHDRRFRRHETFPFVSFGIQQRRQALTSARLQMRRPQFEKEARILATVTVEKLQKACEEEEQGLPISDPAIRLLQRSVYATASHVNGSNQQRIQYRGQIWSTCIMKNPATLWITINPTDIHDPIAQIFAGESINLDAFLSHMGPDQDQRARNIADDPYAAAKFFHFIIRVILETLFGVQVTNFQVQNKGRGTLHFHLLLWLEDAPTADTIMELLKSEQFRSRVADYIRQNLRAYIPGLDSAESVKSIPRQKDIAFSRPVNPDAPDYDQQLAYFELRLARCEQIHTCRIRQCLVQDKNGTFRCKRRAPFQLSDVDSVDETGEWRQKRLYGYVNGWIPGILVNVRCNNDGKLLTHGSDTKKVARYTTTYAAKKQGKSYNASAVMAKGYAYHLDHLQASGGCGSYLDGIRDVQRLLLFRLVHALNREQELAAPMVISYLMGWGDAYRSHHYSPIYWSSFVHALLRAYPSLRISQRSLGPVTDSTSEPAPFSLSTENVTQTTEEAADVDNHSVTIDLSSRGTIYAKSQVTDYCARGTRLETFNVVSFFTDTYERIRSVGQTKHSDEDKETSVSVRVGRPPNERVSYLPEHPKAKTVQRIIRSKDHNNLPNFIGQRFPRGDDPDTYEFYCASMLMLLKPWRDLHRDLKGPSETWAEAFEAFRNSTSSENRAILSGIRYLHDCETAAHEDRQRGDTVDGRRRQHEDDDGFDNDYESGGNDMVTADGSLTEESLEAVIRAQTSLEEELHGHLAIELAKRAKIFHNEGDSDVWVICDDGQVVGNATGDDLQKLGRWRTQLEAEVARMNEADVVGGDACDIRLGRVEGIIGSNPDGRGDVLPLEQVNMSDLTRGPASQNAEVLFPADPSTLNVDQRRAYDIILWHLDEVLAGRDPPPLRMIIHGEGGTGKSKVLQTVTQAFKARRCQHMLLKAAYTGVAASLIEGKTTHVIGGISAAVRRFEAEDSIGDETKAKLQKFWEHYQYLALDEMSMIAKDFFALLSRNAGIGKGNTDGRSFGGINVIILGDFHQFPPVARPIRDALYYPSNPEIDGLSSQIGRSTYEEFTTVVTLKEQRRISDPVWHDFLQNLRRGTVNSDHIRMLRSLVIGKNSSHAVNFTTEPWNEAVLVTPRHAVRHQWNNAALRKMCRERGRHIFICTAEDTVRGRPIGLREKHALEAHRGKGNRGGRTSKDLPYRIEIALGMKVMVTDNIETDLDITNGARGEIVDIVLHPDEPPINKGEAIIRLKYLPSYLLVKLTRTRATRLEGLDDCIIPIEPVFTTYHIKVSVGRRIVQRTVKRKQFPLTAAYAFTDYRSQGQTIPYVVVDIATPPTGGLSLFNLYVALSRSSGRDSIRLLRDFDDKLFEKPHDWALIQEDERLEVLDRQTRIWYEQVVQAQMS